MLKRIIILGGVLVIIMMIVKSAGNFLVVDEKPVKSDVIIVLTGEGRLEKGVKLYKEGFAPFLLLSSVGSEQSQEQALRLGVPASSILLENQSTSTLENARFSKEVVINHQFHSAIVVSSNYHMRRVKILFDQAFKDSDIRLTYVAGENPSYEPNKWWKTKKDRNTTLTEYTKLVGNLFGYHGDNAKKVLYKFHLGD